MREFQRRVRLALEEHHLLPGDPNRVFNTFTAEDRDSKSPNPTPGSAPQAEPKPATDPTTLKPQETNRLLRRVVR